MKHTFYIKGMSCSGCESTVKERLEKINGVENVTVSAKEKTAILLISKEISFSELQSSLEGTHYSIHKKKEETVVEKKQLTENQQSTGVFYCPMQCEGEKTYQKAGDCPVCGMDLVEQISNGTEHIFRNEELKIKELRNKLWGSVLFTIPIFIIAMSEMIHPNPLYRIMPQRGWNWVQLLLSLPVVFYFCRIFFERAFRSVKTLNFNMFTLIGIGAGVAWIFSLVGLILPNIFPNEFRSHYGEVFVYFEATCVILTLVMLGQFLEASAHRKTNNAIKSLLDLTPRKALIINGNYEEEIPIEEVKKGDILRIKSGEKIPVDGIIIQGESTIDESMITGEPVPIHKKTDDRVSAGTLNGTQTFTMKAEKVGSETLLAQIVEMVQKASRSQAPIQKLSDKIARIFVPIVVVISVITFVVWAVFGGENAYIFAFANAISVLIIACPCALGLATPMSVMVGIGKAAQNGVLIKNAEALEALNQIDTLIIDKTGTLTEGKPSVEKVVLCSEISEKEALQWIYSLNQHSVHPIAKATNDFSKEKGISAVEIINFNEISGKGVEGNHKNNHFYFGNDKLLADMGILIPISVGKQVKEEQKQGKTISFLAKNHQIIAYVVISDKIKASTLPALKELDRMNIEIKMLTGDNPFTAKYVAHQLGLKNYTAGMLPQSKQNEIEKLQKEGKKVAMTGDGINDAPALAQANVGIAMGNGTDIAIESASITLLKGDLNGIVKAKKLSRAIIKNSKENLFFALIYNAIGIPIAAGILYPFFGTLLSPMLGAVAMSFSSVSVIANALRLRNFKI